MAIGVYTRCRWYLLLQHRNPIAERIVVPPPFPLLLLLPLSVQPAIHNTPPPF